MLEGACSWNRPTSGAGCLSVLAGRLLVTSKITLPTKDLGQFSLRLQVLQVTCNRQAREFLCFFNGLLLVGLVAPTESCATCKRALRGEGRRTSAPLQIEITNTSRAIMKMERGDAR